MISPYLLRPVRSLDEVINARRTANQLEVVIRNTLAKSNAEGDDRQSQIRRATMTALRLDPELSPKDALLRVQKVIGGGHDGALRHLWGPVTVNGEPTN